MKRGIAGLVAAMTLLLLSGSAEAATIVVGTTKDADGAGNCKLRRAMDSAATDSSIDGCTAGSGDDVIKLPSGVYTISNVGPDDQIENGNLGGDLDFGDNDNLTIEAANPTDKVVIDGGEGRRVFDASGIKDGALTLRNLEIRSGRASGENGGALRINTDFVLDGVTMVDNRAQNGGAIAAASGAKGTIVNSTISGNRATKGGGLFVFSAAQVTVRSSTITANEAAADGGGVANEDASTLSLVNTVNAANVDSSGDNLSPDCRTTAGFSARFVVTSQAIGAGQCLAAASSASNILATDPGLSAVFDNGGPTRTHLPKAGSPVLLAGGKADPDLCPSVDQRGVARPAGRCDIGAVQVSEALVPVVTCDDDPLMEGCPFGPIAGPTATTGTFVSGAELHLLVKCPARFKPKCVTRAVPVTQAGFRKVKRGKKVVRIPKGKTMASVKKVTIRSGKRATVTFQIKPAYRDLVSAMLTVDDDLLITRQQIRSKRIYKKKNRRTTTVFHTYKVRLGK